MSECKIKNLTSKAISLLRQSCRAGLFSAAKAPVSHHCGGRDQAINGATVWKCEIKDVNCDIKDISGANH